MNEWTSEGSNSKKTKTSFHLASTKNWKRKLQSKTRSRYIVIFSGKEREREREGEKKRVTWWRWRRVFVCRSRQGVCELSWVECGESVQRKKDSVFQSPEAIKCWKMVVPGVGPSLHTSSSCLLYYNYPILFWNFNLSIPNYLLDLTLHTSHCRVTCTKSILPLFLKLKKFTTPIPTWFHSSVFSL